MFSRQQYMNHVCTHEQYYGQFVTGYIRATVATLIGTDAIKKSKDAHFNDIALKQWDNLLKPLGSSKLAANLKACGDWWGLLACVCIAKEAARQIKANS
jgi:hypothetical protein